MDLHNPHNDLFGFTFNDKQSVITFVKKFLPKPITDNLDYSYFVREDTSHITKEMKAFFSDKVWSSRWKGTTTPIKVSLLFEHKSSPENPWIQLNQYLLEGYRQQILEQRAANKKAKKRQPIRLTVIIPILFYHGEQTWHYRDFDEYFDLPDPYLKRFIPNFQYLLTDLSQYTDEELFAMEVGFLLSTLLLLKNKRNKDFIKQYHEEIFIFVEQLKDDPVMDDFLNIMILYILKTYDLEKEEVMNIAKELPPKVEKIAKSAYDRFVEEGKAIGLKEAKLEVALSLLVEIKLEMPQIVKATNIPLTLLQQIKDNYQKKQLAKAQAAVLKYLKKNYKLDKTDIDSFNKLIEKYYLLFHKKEK